MALYKRSCHLPFPSVTFLTTSPSVVSLLAFAIMTAPESSIQALYWLAAPMTEFPFIVPRPRSLNAFRTIEPSGSAINGMAHMYNVPPEFCQMTINPADVMPDDTYLEVWHCAEATIHYRDGQFVVDGVMAGVKPFVVGGLSPVYPHVLHHPRPDTAHGPLSTIARQASTDDVQDTPMLVLWRCTHGTLFVQAHEASVPSPPGSASAPTIELPSLPEAPSPPQSSNGELQSVRASDGSAGPPPPTARLASPWAPPANTQSAVPPPTMHPSLSFATRAAPISPAGRPLSRPTQPQALAAPGTHHAPGVLPSLSPRMIKKLQDKKRRTVDPRKHTSVARSSVSGCSTLQSGFATPPPPPPPPPPAPSPTAIPRSPPPPITSCAPSPGDVPKQTTQNGQRNEQTPPPLTPAASSSLTPSSSAAPRTPSPAARDDAPTSSELVCGINNCQDKVTPVSWEPHYMHAHELYESKWKHKALCPHRDCSDPAALAAKASRTQKTTFGSWQTFKRHVLQVHMPGGGAHVCPIPGCGRVFSRPDAALRHCDRAHDELAESARKRVRVDWIGRMKKSAKVARAKGSVRKVSRAQAPSVLHPTESAVGTSRMADSDDEYVPGTGDDEDEAMDMDMDMDMSDPDDYD
ncbi:hypothetical protein BD310DRAFT_938762 [Dichomitus squalens]|uniref:C2H2-type domain-containing protein n=1 Tax=Dichomitus squalens TaxID=114155 RepID=A0A4Q9PE38_9APHY|nr:hypothetical protein BD310DRAFT_938762 [Dichomitus squalens]